MNHHAKRPANRQHAFTLVELIAVMTIIAILVGVSALPMLGLIEQARYKAERDHLAILANEARMSFRQDDLNKNLSALKPDMPGTTPHYVTIGSAPPSVYPALFDANMPAAGEIVNEHAWYARLTKLRGQTVYGGILNDQNGDIRSITYNAYQRRRVMLAGPLEKGQQRYIILSFMFQDGPLLPAAPTEGRLKDMGAGEVSNPDYEGWFNAIYDAEWGDKADSAPTGWGWDAGMQAAWNNGYRGRSYMQRVIAQRIVQPRYQVTINNNSHGYDQPGGTPGVTVRIYSDSIYIYANMVRWTSFNYSGLRAQADGRELPATVVPRYDSVKVFPERDEGILEGRRVVIRRGAGTESGIVSEEAAVVVESFLLNENTTYTAQ